MEGDTSAKVVKSSNAAFLVLPSMSLFLVTTEQNSMMVGNMSLNILGASSTKSINASRTRAKESSWPFCKNIGNEFNKLGSNGANDCHTLLGKPAKNATKAVQAAIATSSSLSSKPELNTGNKSLR